MATEEDLPTFRVLPTAEGSYRWSLVGSDGQLLAADSIDYPTESDCLDGIIAVGERLGVAIPEVLADGPQGPPEAERGDGHLGSDRVRRHLGSVLRHVAGILSQGSCTVNYIPSDSANGRKIGPTD